MPWHSGLEGQSLEIARSPASPLRVIAGPGTGKTFALMRRLARLIEEGNDPSRILLVTFTRVSAADLAGELEGLGLPGAQEVVKGTLHSLCFSILNRRQVLEFTRRVARPLLAFEERFLLGDLARCGDFGDIHQRRRSLKAFEAAWAREQDQEPGWAFDPREQAFQGALEEWLRFHEGMLIDEIVPLTLKYLRTNPAAPERQRFDHVLVDEYQDLNKAEQSLIDLFAGRASLTVVGDQDQAIYEGFRYAHPEGIQCFHEVHEGTQDLPLTRSRRCSSAMVRLANALISHNQRRSGRELGAAEKPAEVDVHMVQWPTMAAEAEGISEHIARAIRRKQYDPGRVLVLCPCRPMGYLIRDQLKAREIGAHSYFHEEAFEGNPKRLPESRAQEAFTVLTLLASPGDRVALRAWLGFGHANLRADEFRRLRDYCAGAGLSPLGALEAIWERRMTLPGTSGLFQRYALLVERLSELRALAPSEAFDQLFPEGEGWAEPFRAVCREAGEGLGHADARDLLRARITQPDLPSTADFVRIMSLHKCKGLTADHVFVTGCVEGLIPHHGRCLAFEEERRRHEEQRRLFYVAITRAKRTLVLSSTSTLPRELAHKMRIPVRRGGAKAGETIASSFLSELGPTCPPAIEGPVWLSGMRGGAKQP